MDSSKCSIAAKINTTEGRTAGYLIALSVTSTNDALPDLRICALKIKKQTKFGFSALFKKTCSVNFERQSELDGTVLADNT